jgi:hypothetical protein
MDEANETLILQYKDVSDNLQKLDNKINDDFAEVKKEINKVNLDLNQQITDKSDVLTEKIETGVGKVRNLLKTTTDDITKQLNQIVDSVKALPSKNEIDEAIAKIIEKFNQSVVDNVSALDEKTKQKLEAIETQLKEGFKTIGDQQSNQQEERKQFDEKIIHMINNQAENIKSFTQLVRDTKESNNNLLDKFIFMENNFNKLQITVDNSNKSYDDFLKNQEGHLNKILNELNAIKALENRFNDQNQRIDNLEKTLLEMQKEAKEREEEALLREKERDKNLVDQLKETGANICSEVTKEVKKEVKKIISDLPTKQEVLTMLPHLNKSQKKNTGGTILLQENKKDFPVDHPTNQIKQFMGLTWNGDNNK